MVTGEKIDIRAELLGDDDVIELLQTMRRRAKDFRPVFDEFGDYYAAWHFRRFAQSGSSPGTGRWAPLDPKYKARKVARWGSRPILVRTGRLFHSLNHRPFAVESIGKRRAEFGTDVKYAKYHQTGTRFMPKRRIIVPLTKGQMTLLEEMVADHILPIEIVRELRGAV